MVGSRSAAARGRGSRAVRAAAALHVFLGVAFGASVPFVLAHLARNGELPMSPFGWRLMAGPFEQLGPERFTALGWALVAVSALDVVAGIWLWQGRRRGLRLGPRHDRPSPGPRCRLRAATATRGSAGPGGPRLGWASRPPIRATLAGRQPGRPLERIEWSLTGSRP